MSLPMRANAEEQRMKLVKSSGMKTASSSPAGKERTHLEMRVTPREVSLSLDSGDNLVVVAIASILAFAGMVIAFILS